jgi:hypothetical protein
MERALRPFVIVYLANASAAPQELAREPSRRAGLARMAVEAQRLRAHRAKGTVRLLERQRQRRDAGVVLRDEPL